MLWQAPKAGMLVFYIGTSPDKVEQADAAFHKAVLDLAAQKLPIKCKFVTRADSGGEA